MCESECECVHMNPILTATQRSGFLILVVGNYGWGERETKDPGRGQVPFSIPVQTLGLSSPAPQPACSSTSRAVLLQPRRSVGSHFMQQFSPTSKSNNFWEAASWVRRGSHHSHLALQSLPRSSPDALDAPTGSAPLFSGEGVPSSLSQMCGNTQNGVSVLLWRTRLAGTAGRCGRKDGRSRGSVV